jgi:hypothetical protein
MSDIQEQKWAPHEKVLVLYYNAKTSGKFNKRFANELNQLPLPECQEAIQAAFNVLGFSRDIEMITDDRTLFGWVMATALGASWNPEANKYQTRDERLDHM